MSNIIRNVPINCTKCGLTGVRGHLNTLKQNNQMVTECQWRCYRCGNFIKKGITKVVDLDEK